MSSRHADLWLTDFLQNPFEVAALLPAPPRLVHRKGDPVGNRQLPARRNVLVYGHEFSQLTLWSEAIEGLIQSLGGWEAMGRLLRELDGARRMIQLVLPINGSPHQENNFIETATLARMAALEIDLGMEFGQHTPNDELREAT